MENEAEDAEKPSTNEVGEPSNEEQAETREKEEPGASALPNEKEKAMSSGQSDIKPVPIDAGSRRESQPERIKSNTGPPAEGSEADIEGPFTATLGMDLEPEVTTALANLNMFTVTGRLQREWMTDGEKEAIVFYDHDDVRTSFTNAQFRRKVETCASFLRCNGVRKYDIVCNALDISLEREVVNFAILFCGAVVMDGLCIVDEGPRFWVPLKKAKVKHLIVDPSDTGSLAWRMVAKDVETSYADIERATLLEVPELEKIFKFRLQHLMKTEEAQKAKSGFQLLDEHGATFVEVVNSTDPAVIFTTRTGMEEMYKMVLRNHISVIQLAQRAKELLGLTRDDVVYCDRPICRFGEFALVYTVVGFTMVKSTLNTCPPQRVVRETWDVLEQELCTVASLDPPLIVMLASHCEDLPADHWHLRSIVTSGVVKPFVTDAIGSVTSDIFSCYSVIEAGLVSRLRVHESTKTRFSQGCVGELSDPQRTRLDIHGSGAVKPSKIGEIVLRGKLVCKQYFNDPHLTQASIQQDGYFKTGDLGFYDSQPGSPYHDMLFVLGKKSEAIIRGDTPIFPEEIEEKVNQCPGIWKVSVVTIRDEKGVIQMCACVIPRSQDSVTVERVKEFCRYMLGGTADEDDNPHMPTYVFFFTDFPMLGNKVDKHTLAHTTAAVINGSEHISA